MGVLKGLPEFWAAPSHSSCCPGGRGHCGGRCPEGVVGRRGRRWREPGRGQRGGDSGSSRAAGGQKNTGFDHCPRYRQGQGRPWWGGPGEEGPAGGSSADGDSVDRDAWLLCGCRARLASSGALGSNRTESRSGPREEWRPGWRQRAPPARCAGRPCTPGGSSPDSWRRWGTQSGPAGRGLGPAPPAASRCAASPRRRSLRPQTPAPPGPPAWVGAPLQQGRGGGGVGCWRLWLWGHCWGWGDGTPSRRPGPGCLCAGAGPALSHGLSAATAGTLGGCA